MRRWAQLQAVLLWRPQADLIESSSLPWEPTADPRACMGRASRSAAVDVHSSTVADLARTARQAIIVTWARDVGRTTTVPKGVTCWQYPAFPKPGNLYYNVLPRHGMPPKEAGCRKGGKHNI